MVLRKQRLGDILVEANVLSLAQLNIALERMKFSKMRLGEQLVKLRMCTEDDIVNALSKQLRIPVVDLSTTVFDSEVFTVIPKSLAAENNCIPFRIEGSSISIAFADPLKLDRISHLESQLQRSIKKYIAAQTAIEKAIEEKYIHDDAAEQLMRGVQKSDDIEQADLSALDESLQPKGDEAEESDAGTSEDLYLTKMASEKSTANAVNLIIMRSITDGASDIHIEPQRTGVVIRQRIDGILTEMTRMQSSVARAVISRIKVLAGLDIAERRIPQDGKVSANLSKERKVDLRVSTVPTKFGEKVVIRILDQSKTSLQLQDLFFEPDVLKRVKGIIGSSQGMVLVTGPTGSGKTTTLYSFITALRSPTTNIVTIEDPIEYELDGINQVQVNHKIGLSFAKVLRSVLRQDPEIVLVGEIRDSETATVAFQAAQTGHLVFSTLHTNNTYATIARLLDIGVEPQAIAGSVQGIFAQRLVRRVCKHCKAEYTPEEHELIAHNIPAGTKLYRGEGCEQCKFSGYKGRLSVVEIMTMSPELRAAISEGKPEHVIKKAAVNNGMELMYEVGRRYVLQGLTTTEELSRVLETVDDSFERVAEATDSNNGSSAIQFAPPNQVAQEPPKQQPQAVTASCPNCNESVKIDWKACPFCGVKLDFQGPPKCATCGEEVKPNWKACPHCGNPITSAVSQPTQTAKTVAPSISPQPRQSEQLPAYEKPRVLVVDDQKSMQKLVTIALQGINCDVATADDGVQALEVVRQYRPHLIVLDIVMPKMDGLEVCRRLRADVRTAFIPIMMLTSLADEKSRLKGYVAGTDDYLAKPFVLEEFYSRVRNLLRRTYGYFTADDELLGVGEEWDSATEEAKTRQKIEDRASMKESLEKAEPKAEESSDEAEYDPFAEK